jgi:hypothetical protein
MLNAKMKIGLVETFARTCQSENLRDIWNSEYLSGLIKTNQTSRESRRYVGNEETHRVLWTGNVME